ncbi:YolD-like family protein [Virgibacillus sp. SK37]|uniref:YolD-like family protein n=1 Tax=Virgibacillus sp. SK37 TaxID=403957 RepID=UPI00059562BB|nr:YolD-like family protein [Virgibacillus sp. SK37]
MVNDRGNIKWTSIMMPEHINLLKQMWEEKDHKKKPILDEQQVNEISLKLQLAISNDLNVSIDYYKQHDFHKINGKLIKIDLMRKYL